MGDLILLRHGETEWSRAGKHTGRTDIPLTPRGEAAAASLAPLLASRGIAAVFTSPAKRAIRTAELALGAAAAAAKPDPDLWEWDYGGYEGMTTAEIQQTRPGWYLWHDGVIPGDTDPDGTEHPGETVQNVGERADRVLARARPLLPDGDVVLVAHGHVLRVLTARWLGLEPADGRLFRLDTGTLSALGTEHDEPVILSWNSPGGSPRLPSRGTPRSRPRLAPR
jgi:probable phosphoglycerate mutase